MLGQCSTRLGRHLGPIGRHPHEGASSHSEEGTLWAGVAVSKALDVSLPNDDLAANAESGQPTVPDQLPQLAPAQWINLGGAP